MLSQLTAWDSSAQRLKFKSGSIKSILDWSGRFSVEHKDNSIDSWVYQHNNCIFYFIYPREPSRWNYFTVNANSFICILNAASSQLSTSSGKAMHSHHLLTKWKIMMSHVPQNRHFAEKWMPNKMNASELLSWSLDSLPKKKKRKTFFLVIMPYLLK